MSRPPTEQELIDRARRGDGAAFAQLARAHENISFRTAYLIARNAADAEDAAQVGLVKAYRALGRFHTGSPFRPWLLRIVANEARNRRRSAGRRDGLALRVAHEAASGDAAPSPEGSVLASERRRALAAALDALRDADREILTYRHLLELSEQETATVLGVRIGTVKSRNARALARLREHLGEAP